MGTYRRPVRGETKRGNEIYRRKYKRRRDLKNIRFRHPLTPPPRVQKRKDERRWLPVADAPQGEETNQPPEAIRDALTSSRLHPDKVRSLTYSSPCSASQRSASSAAMQPVPAAVTAWR